ncbi:MAG: ATP-binding protein [Euryarchaeota archaeon]|nr:ATP-binding protein [Euryarchaeota archaeon]MCG2727993.1 ATP-binding protein [Candidatus Methanoperedenaceae archaeon]
MIKRETWIKVIKDFNEFKLPELVERDIKISEIPIKRAVSIIGPRRAGKTYLMFQVIRDILKKNIEKSRLLYINLESDLLTGCELSDLRTMIELFYEIYPENKNKKVYLFLDEIQTVSGWEKLVRAVMDSENIQVYLSGSSSKLLSKEIATGLRGRTIPYYVYPFSFREFLRAKGFKIEKYLSSSRKALLLNLLDKFMKGSYPEAVFFEEEKEKILREILDVTIYRDVVERFKVKNIKVLKLLLKNLIASNYFSVHGFYRYLKSMGIKVGKNTLYIYIDNFSDAMVLYMLRNYSESYKKVEQTIPKPYFVDNGLLVVNGIESNSRLMENAVFLELVRRGFTTENSLFYYDSQKEVDFVLKEGGKIARLIQVCYDIDDFSTKERELSALAKAGEELNCSDMRVITYNYENIEDYKGWEIKFVPLWKWLIG